MASPSRNLGRWASRSALLFVGVGLATASAAQADSLSSGRVVTPAGVEVCAFAVANSPGGGRSGLLYTTGPNCGDVSTLTARLGRGRKLGPSLRLARRTSSKPVEIFAPPRIVVGANGTAVAAWVVRERRAGRDRLKVAIAPPGRRFGAAKTLTTRRLPRGHIPEIQLNGLVMGRDGRIVVSWQIYNRRSTSLHAAVRMRGGRFGSQQTLGSISPVTPYPGAESVLAVSPSGIVVAAWAPTEAHTAIAATLAVGKRRFRSRKQISGSDNAAEVRVADGPGGAGVSWHVRSANGGPVLMRLARLRRDATLAGASTISTADTAGGRLEVDGPQVAFTSRSPFAAWRVFSDISEAGDGRVDTTTVQAAIAAPAGVARSASLTPAGTLVGTPVVGALSDRALLAWSEGAGPNRGRLRLAVNRSGDWAPARTFSEISGPFRIAASRRNAVIAWRVSSSGSNGRVRLAVYSR